ncbi:MAG TPA: hypothetical protein VMB48_00720 [Steroidobacteraceae bacterium]|nr:hypothetical protein [Steroidobacteraceae bacterium]
MKFAKTRLPGAVMLSVLAWTALSAESCQSQTPSGVVPDHGTAHLVPVVQFKVRGQLDAAAARTSIVYEGNSVYLTLPDSLLRGTAPLGPASQLQPIFTPASRVIERMYDYDHILYVVARPREDSADHALFRSADGGRTFLPIDAGLLECTAGRCTRLQSTQLLARAGLLYVNAGGGRNLLVSANGGTSYEALSGEVGSIACYHGTFALIGRTALLGGECGLDQAYLERGILSANGHGVASAFKPVKSPSLSNRKVSVIANDPDTPPATPPLVLAGAEGALLRSTDGGVSFQYVIQYFDEQGIYPYVGQILFPRVRSDLILIGGFDKAGFKPFLAYGTRDGRKWADISYLLGSSGDNAVTDLAEDSSGRLLVVAANEAARRISIYEVNIGP